jgi:hypothetical protein
VLGEVFVGLGAARFDDGDVESGFGEAFCGPAAGGAGPDYQDVEICWGVGSGHVRSGRDRRGSDAGIYEWMLASGVRVVKGRKRILRVRKFCWTGGVSGTIGGGFVRFSSV